MKKGMLIISILMAVAFAVPALAEGPVEINYNGVPGTLHYWEVAPYTVDYTIDLADGRTIEATNVELRPFVDVLRLPSAEAKAARGEDQHVLFVTDGVPMAQAADVIRRYSRDYDVIICRIYPETLMSSAQGSKGDCDVESCMTGAIYACSVAGELVSKVEYDEGHCSYVCSGSKAGFVECVTSTAKKRKLDNQQTGGQGQE